MADVIMVEMCARGRDHMARWETKEQGAILLFLYQPILAN
jgi:hypothetical protein